MSMNCTIWKPACERPSSGRSPDCISAWLPKEQWDVCVETLFKQGVHQVDARSVPLILQLGTSAMACHALSSTFLHFRFVISYPLSIDSTL